LTLRTSLTHLESGRSTWANDHAYALAPCGQAVNYQAEIGSESNGDGKATQMREQAPVRTRVRTPRAKPVIAPELCSLGKDAGENLIDDSLDLPL